MAGHRPSAPKISVLIVADRQLVGEAVRMAVASRRTAAVCITLPTTAPERLTLVRRIQAHEPHVGVLLWELTEPAFLRRAIDFLPLLDLPWLLLTSSSDPRMWGGLTEAGVVGVLPIESTLEDLMAAIRRVAQGQTLMSAGARGRVVEAWRDYDARQKQVEARLARLTRRERAVLESLALGSSVRDIAAKDGVAEGTVRSQVKSILRKLQVNSQLAAVTQFRLVIPVSPPSGGPRSPGRTAP